MKFLILALLFIFTFSRSICCENCGVNTLDEEYTLQNVDISDECLDKRVCRVNCGFFVKGCDKKLYYEVESTSMIDSLAYKTVCLDRHASYQYTQERRDHIWEKMIPLIKKILPHDFKIIENSGKLYNYRETEFFIYSIKKGFTHKKLLVLLIRFIKYLRTIKKLCKKHDSLTEQFKQLKGLIFDFKRTHKKEPVPDSDKGRIKYIEEHISMLTNFGGAKQYEEFLQNKMLSTLSRSSKKDIELFDEFREGMYEALKDYLKDRSSRSRTYFCNCLGFKNYGIDTKNFFNSNPRGFLDDLIRAYMMNDVPKGFHNSALESKIHYRLRKNIEKFNEENSEKYQKIKEKCKKEC